MKCSKKTVIIFVILLIMLSLLVIFVSLFIHQSHQQNDRLFENDICYNKDGVQGFCKRLDSCDTGILAIKSGKPPKICSFMVDHPVVCCPPNDVAVPTTTQASWNRPEVTTKPSRIEDTTTPSSVIVPLSNNGGSSSPATIARKYCAEYSKSVLVEISSPLLGADDDKKEIIDYCAIIEEPLVVGGLEAKPREYPHMALIGYRETNVEWLCGGSLISDRFVLSAAHCSRPNRKGPALWAKLGELDTSSDFDDASPQIIRIIERINHPEYSAVTLYNDISLFKLQRKVRLDPFIRPICLSISNDIKAPKAIATGWGHTSWDKKSINLDNNANEDNLDKQPKLTPDDIRLENSHQLEFESGTGSANLMKVKLSIVNNTFCNLKYESSVGKTIPNGIREESMICAGDEVGKDTCQGDSGGPLQVPIKTPYCMYDLIGLTSFGRACGSGNPGVYTKVSYYLPWIVQNVWPEG